MAKTGKNINWKKRFESQPDPIVEGSIDGGSFQGRYAGPMAITPPPLGVENDKWLERGRTGQFWGPEAKTEPDPPAPIDPVVQQRLHELSVDFHQAVGSQMIVIEIVAPDPSRPVRNEQAREQKWRGRQRRTG